MTTAQTTDNNATPAMSTSENGQRNFPPRFYLYHANANGTGSAIRISIAPATSESEGAFFISMAQQSGVAGQAADGTKQFARFDWMNRTTVKFGVVEVAQMLQVIRGCTNSVNGDKGLYHDSRATTTGITFARVTDPMPGYNLAFARTSKDGNNQRVRTWFFFREHEAIALEAVMGAALPVMALGVITERRGNVFENNVVPSVPMQAVAVDAPMPF